MTGCGVLSQSGDRQVRLPVPSCPEPLVDVSWYGPKLVPFTDGSTVKMYGMIEDDREILDEWIAAWISCARKRGETIKVLNGD